MGPLGVSPGMRIPVVLAALALVVPACGGDDSDSQTEPGVTEPASGGITGSVKEWSVQVDSPSSPPGEVTFTVTNDGTVDHEFLVVRTDAPDGSIPLDGQQFSEDDRSLTVVDEIPPFAPGSTETLTVTLEPGTYQLVCNLPGHYASGMHTPFGVTGDSQEAPSSTDVSGSEPSGTDGSGSSTTFGGSTQPEMQSGGVGNQPGEDDGSGYGS